MKVYVIYDKDGWETLGVEAIFDSFEKAKHYLISTGDAIYVQKRYNMTLNEFWTEDRLKSEIIEFEVQ